MGSTITGLLAKYDDNKCHNSNIIKEIQSDLSNQFVKRFITTIRAFSQELTRFAYISICIEDYISRSPRHNTLPSKPLNKP